MLNNIYATTCGRLFLKNTKHRTIKSFEDTPTLKGTFYRFIKSKQLKQSDFDIVFSGKRNSSNKKLFYFKYKKWCCPFFELKGCIDTHGYRIVNIGGENYKFHRILMMKLKYIDGCEKMQVNHIDGDKTNNVISNLEWCDSKMNIAHAWDNKLAKRTTTQNKKLSITLLNKLDITHVLDKNCNDLKSNIKSFLKRRGYDINDFEFIATGKSKCGHKLGYVKSKDL